MSDIVTNCNYVCNLLVTSGGYRHKNSAIVITALSNIYYKRRLFLQCHSFHVIIIDDSPYAVVCTILELYQHLGLLSTNLIFFFVQPFSSNIRSIITE